MPRLILGTLVSLFLIASPASSASACVDPDGEFNSTPQVTFLCPSWGITWTVDTWNFTDLGGGSFVVTPTPGTLPDLPGTLNCSDSTFAAQVSEGDGFCSVQYTLVGKFTSATHWTGNFTAQFFGYCEICGTPSDAVEGHNTTVSVGGTLAPPMRLALLPNPVRERAEIALSLPRGQSVRIEVLDLSGRRVGLLHDGVLPEGNHSIQWNRRSTAGSRVASGLYFVRAQTGREQRMVKAVVVD